MHDKNNFYRQKIEDAGIRLARAFVIWTSRVLTGARAVWIDTVPSPAQRIYFANHSSHFDTPALLAALPRNIRGNVRPIAAKDYWNSSKVHRFIAEQCLQAILIDRKREEDKDPLLPVIEAMEKGASIIIFPEGTRGDGVHIGPFKSGLHRLAQRFPQAELVPVNLENLARIMPKGSFLIVPISCLARFGAPIKLHPDESHEAFLSRARESVQNLARPLA